MQTVDGCISLDPPLHPGNKLSLLMGNKMTSIPLSKLCKNALGPQAGGPCAKDDGKAWSAFAVMKEKT